MKRVAGLIVSVMVAGAVYAFAQESPKEIVIKDIQKAQPPVTLSHEKHAKTLSIKCVECHHTYKEGEKKVEKCSSCHKAEAEGKKVGLKEAYHKNCIECHKKEKAAGKAAPTLCKDCHKK